MHPFDRGHALSGFVPKKVNIAHQTEAFQQEDLLLRIALFVGQHHVAKLRGHDFGKFQSSLLDVAFYLVQRLGGVLHPKHAIVMSEHPLGYHGFAVRCRLCLLRLWTRHALERAWPRP